MHHGTILSGWERQREQVGGVTGLRVCRRRAEDCSVRKRCHLATCRPLHPPSPTTPPPSALHSAAYVTRPASDCISCTPSPLSPCVKQAQGEALHPNPTCFSSGERLWGPHDVPLGRCNGRWETRIGRPPPPPTAPMESTNAQAAAVALSLGGPARTRPRGGNETQDWLPGGVAHRPAPGH